MFQENVREDFWGFRFSGLGFLNVFLPSSVLSVGLYRVFENSRNSEKQTKLLM